MHGGQTERNRTIERGASGFAPAPARRGGFSPDPLPVPGTSGFRPAGAGEPGAAAPPPTPDAPVLDVEAIRREAYENGVRAGRAALPWQEAEALTSAAAALAAAEQALVGLRGRYLVENRRTIVELACAVAEHVLGTPVAGREALAGLVARAVELFPPEEPLALHLCPADQDVLAALPDGALGALPGGTGRIALVADPSLAPGELRLAGPSGDVRTAVAEVLARLRVELGDAVLAAGPLDPRPEIGGGDGEERQ